MGILKPCKRGHTGGRYKGGACTECMALRKGRAGRTVPPTRLDKLEKATIVANRAEVEARKTKARAERQLARLELKVEKQELLARGAAAWREKDLAKAERIQAVREGYRAPQPPKLVKFETQAGEYIQFDAHKAPPEKPEYLTTSRIDTEGRTHTDYMRDRDGNPIPAHPVAAPPAKPAEPEKPKVPEPPKPINRGPARIPKICVGGVWREMTPAEIEQSRPKTQNAGYRLPEGPVDGLTWEGNFNPGGVVSHASNHSPPLETDNLWNRTLEGL